MDISTIHLIDGRFGCLFTKHCKDQTDAVLEDDFSLDSLHVDAFSLVDSIPEHEEKTGSGEFFVEIKSKLFVQIAIDSMPFCELFTNIFLLVHVSLVGINLVEIIHEFI